MLRILSLMQTVRLMKRLYYRSQPLIHRNGLRHSASLHHIKTTTTTTTTTTVTATYLAGRNFPVVKVSDKRYFIPRLAIVDYII